jgi:hypothetical protein
MNEVNNNSFKSPVLGTDPITKGTFIISYAHMTWIDEDDDESNNTLKARGYILIRGSDNPLYKIAKESPLRLQGLVASVVFGTEQRFIKFILIPDYQITEDDLISEIEMTVVFEILGNLEYLENVITYKEDNLLK